MRNAALTMALDAVMLELAFMSAYWLRFYSGVWLVPLGIPPWNLYLAASGVTVLVFLSLLYTMGMYGDRGTRRLLDLVPDLLRGVIVGSLLMLALAFFLKREAFSRSFFGLFFLGSLLALMISRVLSQGLLRWQRRGAGRTRMLLVGTASMGERVLWLARHLRDLGLEPVGWLDDTDTGELVYDNLPRRGTLADLRRVVVDQKVDRVVVVLSFSRLDALREIADSLANLKVDLQFVPDLLELRTSKMRLTEIAGIPFISVREVALGSAGRIIKRTFDLVFPLLGLVVLSPLLLLIALLVKLSSRGPVFYAQSRVGRDGREFSMLKFRSMRTDAETDSGPKWTVKSDPRVTPIGRTLRRWSLDELPQLWNVLRGDMSLVGPRPERKVFVEQFSHEMPRYFERHHVKSGLTGWAQVNGMRGNTSIEARTLYDLYYVENWSVWLDIRILLMTVHHVLRGENAY